MFYWFDGVIGQLFPTVTPYQDIINNTLETSYMYIIISFIPHFQTYTVHTTIPKIQCPSDWYQNTEIFQNTANWTVLIHIDIKLNLLYVYIKLQLNIIIFT